MNAAAIWAIVVQSFKESIRAKWLFMFAVLFFTLAINVPVLVLLALRQLPKTFLVDFLVLFVSLSFPFLPLLPLPLGAMSIVEEKESGTLQYVLSNPIPRHEFLLGRLTGLLLSTSLVIFAGFGLAAAVAFNFQLRRYAVLGFVLGIAVALDLIMLTLALLISTLTRRKATALAIGIFLWFTFSIISSLGSLSVVLTINGGFWIMVPLILLNPVESAKLLALLNLNAGYTELGGTGTIIKYALGSQAITALSLSLIAWAIATFSLLILAFRRQDMT